jgi:hypothetical protein
MFITFFIEKDLKQQKVSSHLRLALYLITFIAFFCFLNILNHGLVYKYFFVKKIFCLEQILPLYMPYELGNLPIDFNSSNVYTGKYFLYTKFEAGPGSSAHYNDIFNSPGNKYVLIALKEQHSLEIFCYNTHIKPICEFVSSFFN